ncbi:hypothetical protein GCM10027615_46250 [Plantactinospora veratri]
MTGEQTGPTGPATSGTSRAERAGGPESLATVGLTKAFGGVTALDAATVAFRHGQVNALIGPNGSGKTTFFNCVTGMIRPDSGRTSYRGEEITRRSPHAIARAGIGRTFQLCRVFPRMSALDNVLAAARPVGFLGQLRGPGAGPNWTGPGAG